MQVPVPTTISKSYTIHTGSIKPHHVLRSIAKLLTDDPTKAKKNVWTPTPTPMPTRDPMPPVSGASLQPCLFPLVFCVTSRCSRIAKKRVISIRLHPNETLAQDSLYGDCAA